MKRFKRTSHFEATEKTNEKKEKNVSILILFGLIILGALIGTITFCSMPDNKVLTFDVLSHGFIKNGDSLTVFQNFLRTFKSTGFLIIILFLFGFCAVSQPLEAFVLFYRGIALGISISFIYYHYGFKGFPIVLLMVLPHAVFSSIILILAVREALKSSNLFAGFAFSEKKCEEVQPQIKLYFLKYLILLVMLLASSVIDSVLMVAFKGFL